MSIDDEIDKAARELIRADLRLALLIAGQCPGPHKFVRHRDGRSPWCPTCRYTVGGVKIPPREVP